MRDAGYIQDIEYYIIYVYIYTTDIQYGWKITVGQSICASINMLNVKCRVMIVHGDHYLDDYGEMCKEGALMNWLLFLVIFPSL